MIDRVTLHQLIDALPEERLQNVERVLQYEGITPSSVGRIPDEVAARIREQLVTRPIETDDWDSLRTKMRQGIERRRARFPVHPQFEMRDGALRSAGGHNRSSVLVYEPLPEKGPGQSSVEPLERCELTNCFIEVVLSARLLDKPVTRRRKQIALNRAYSKHLHGPGKSRYRFSGYFETTRLCQRVDERIEGSPKSNRAAQDCERDLIALVIRLIHNCDASPMGKEQSELETWGCECDETALFSIVSGDRFHHCLSTNEPKS